MRFMKYIAAFIVLMSISMQAEAIKSPDVCLHMYLNLLNNFKANDLQSKKRVMNFADQCVPESALSVKRQDFKKLRLLKDSRKMVSIQARM